MGLLDTIGAMAGDASQGDNAKVMGGLISALESHPDGIQGILKSFTANGLGDHATALANGETPAMSTEQVQQGLGGTGLIEKAAEHAGVSTQVVQTALATVLPLIIAHFASNGSAAGAEGESGGLSGMAGSLLKKFL
ncbi:hypothetical protein BH10ACI4_BH10ACI4_22080 [soil metagenome]